MTWRIADARVVSEKHHKTAWKGFFQNGTPAKAQLLPVIKMVTNYIKNANEYYLDKEIKEIP